MGASHKLAIMQKNTMKRLLLIMTPIVMIFNSASLNAQQAPIACFTGTINGSPPSCIVTFMDLSLNTPTSWLWRFGDGTASTIQNPVHAYFVPGNYTVTMKVTNLYGSDTLTKLNLINTSTCYYDTAIINPCDSMTGIREFKDVSRSVEIYPTPCFYSITIKLNYHFKSATLTLCNLYGQVVRQVNNISEQTISLNWDNLPSGLYFLCMTQDNSIIATEKLVIIDN
jgi:PKD repeat protein